MPVKRGTRRPRYGPRGATFGALVGTCGPGVGLAFAAGCVRGRSLGSYVPASAPVMGAPGDASKYPDELPATVSHPVYPFAPQGSYSSVG